MQPSAMTKTEHYYYTDSSFQLELNLQCVRRELIAMLEDFERRDCDTCKKLKCCCTDTKANTVEHSDSGRNSQASNRTPASKQPTAEEVPYKQAPPADTLPKPKWDIVKTETSTEPSTPDKEIGRDIEEWVRAATPSASPNVPEIKRRFDMFETQGDSAFPWSTFKSSWTEKKKTSLEIIGGKIAVEAFFRCFKGYSFPSTQTTVSYTTSTMAAAFKPTPKKSLEYTYF